MSSEIFDSGVDLSSLGDGEPEDATEEGLIKEEKSEWMDILGTGNIMKKVIKEGIPDSRPMKGDVCKIKISGRLHNDPTIIFEESECLELIVGECEIVQGVDITLCLMNTEEVAEIIVKSRFGFGALGFEPLVPPDATLLYEVSLLKVEFEPDLSSIDLKDRLRIGVRKKEKGNWWYSRREHNLATQCYKKALDYLQDTNIPNPPDQDLSEQILKEKLLTTNNLAMTLMKNELYNDALSYLDSVLSLDPDNVKALYRKHKIYQLKGNVDQSIDTLRKALQVDSESLIFKRELSSLLEIKKKDSAKQKNLYKKMIGTEKKKEEAPSKKPSRGIPVKYIIIPAVVAVIIMAFIKYTYYKN